MNPFIAETELIRAVLQDVPFLVAELPGGEIRFGSPAADTLFGVTVKGSLVTRTLFDVLPGLPADYATNPRKTTVVRPAPGGEAGGLTIALNPRQFTGPAGPCVLVVIIEVKSPGAPPARPPEGRDV